MNLRITDSFLQNYFSEILFPKSFHISISKNIISKFIILFRIIFIRAYNGKIETLIVGDVRSIYQIISICILQYKKLVIVDDGIFSVKLIDNIKRNKYTLNFIKDLFLNLAFNELNSIEIHTIFVKKPYCIGKFKICYNKSFRQLNYKQSNSGIFFIGNDCVELGIIEFNDYLKIINSINFCSENVLMYYPHRNESESKLLQISQILGKKF